MSLVSYYSSSDDEKSSNEEETEDKSAVAKVVRDRSAAADVRGDLTGGSGTSGPGTSLFATLPAPKPRQINEPEVLDVKHPIASSSTASMSSSSLGLLNLPAPKKRSTQPIKITAPSLPETNSDDEEEEPSTKKAKPAKTKLNPGHRSLSSPANNIFMSHVGGGENHLAAAREQMRSRNQQAVNVDPTPHTHRQKKHASKKAEDHTMEELLDFSRNAMEQLHKKLELQQQQLVQLTGAADARHGSPMSRSALLQPNGLSSVSAAAGAAPLQGLVQTLAPGWQLQGSPILSAALHPGLTAFMPNPGFRETPTTMQTLPFASPVNSAMENHISNLTKSLLNPLAFGSVTQSAIGPQMSVPRFPLNSAMGIAAQPRVYPVPDANAHQPSPPTRSSLETHSNCCKACIKRIDLLEHQVKKILEHMISKELGQGQVPPPSTEALSTLGPVPFHLATASQNSSPQNTLPQIISFNANSASSASSFTTPSAVQEGQDLQNAIVESLQPCQPPELPSQPTVSSPPKVVYPPQPPDPPVPVKLTPAVAADDDDKYAYQTLMRYKGTSKLFKIDYEAAQAAKRQNAHTDHGNSSSQLSPEDYQQTFPFEFPPVIYSAAVFESLPPKIQSILKVVERDAQGNVTKLEVKQEILSSLTPYVRDRCSVSRRLADVMFTDDERCFCNCSGWRKPAALDPIRMQALTDAVFELCPCPEEEKKHEWHECVKSIDAASRHIVRIRKNKGKMPRHGKWLPTGHKEQFEVSHLEQSVMGIDNPDIESLDYDNLPARLASILDITERDPDGKVSKVEIKGPVLARFMFLSNSRLNVACQLAEILFTREERRGASCLGRYRRRLLDPIRVEALRDGIFKICPARHSEQKQLWAYCVKAIDRISVNPDLSYPLPAASVVYNSDNDDTQMLSEGFGEDDHQSTSSD